ncbi:MAG: hypothetical protein WB711_01465, partial [Terriglobales bacterium]
MGIITSRLMKSKLSVTGWSSVGVSLGKAGYCGGVAVCADNGSAKNDVEGTREEQPATPSRKHNVLELNSLKPRSLPTSPIVGTSRHRKCTGGKHCEQPSFAVQTADRTWMTGQAGGIVATRWDENAGLRRDAIGSQVIDALEAQEIKETGNEED